jgi:hypothetical protein
MKFAANNKLIIQLLSVGLVRFLFVLVMILMVSFASNLDSQKLKPVLGEKPVIAKIMSSQPIEEEYTGAKIEHSLSPVKGNQKERLFQPIINQTAIRYQVDPALVKAIIMAESGSMPRHPNGGD